MNKKSFENYDFGKVIYSTLTKEYYCGMKKFSTQLRDAKVYHSDRYLKEAIQTLVNSYRVNPENIEIREVEMRVTNSYRYS